MDILLSLVPIALLIVLMAVLKQPGDRSSLITLVMDRENLRAINSMAPSDSARTKVKLMANYLRHHDNYNVVPDPYYGTDHDFEVVIELLEDACEGLIEEMLGDKGSHKGKS